MRLLHLVRHGLTRTDFTQPSRDWPLAGGARTGVEALADLLPGRKLSRAVSGPDLRAVQTARILATRLALPLQLRDGLEEHHRPDGQRPDSDEEFHRCMTRLFSRPQEVVFGSESARMAVERFHAAVRAIMAESEGDELIVSHGTVISLLVEKGGGGTARSVWSRLKMPDLVVLEWPGLRRVDP